MNIDQFKLNETLLAYSKQDIATPKDADFLMLFTSRANLERPSWLTYIQNVYEDTPIVSCSTSGEIYEDEVLDDSVSAIAVQFDKTDVSVELVHLNDFSDSFEAGRTLANKFTQHDLKHIFVTSDGWMVNGSQLIEGMYSILDHGVTISGGMAGDGANFAQTMVGVNKDIKSGNIAAIAFYGSHIQVGFGTHGGWNEFGPTMKVTRASGRVVYELDGKPALDLYKTHLGNDVEGLPGTSLLYPVAVDSGDNDEALVRTVHNIDELNKSVILGEEILEGINVRFMKAIFDDPLQGVENAALSAQKDIHGPIELAIVVSCIGRKLLFGQNIQREIDVIKSQLGDETSLIGFYSYGEICPIKKEFAELHHQMITVTSFLEL